jgi:hypothetical protein
MVQLKLDLINLQTYSVRSNKPSGFRISVGETNFSLTQIVQTGCGALHAGTWVTSRGKVAGE